MTFDKGGRFYGRDILPGYRISVNGRKGKMTMEYLGKLTATNEIQEIGVKK
jgi:hypothetical protein